MEETYELEPAYILAAPGITWQVFLKKTEVELELLTDTDMLLMIPKSIRDGLCHTIQWYARTNNKDIKVTMSQKLPADSFEWSKVLIMFEEEFTQNYDEDSGKGYIPEVDFNYPKELQKITQ